MQSRPVYLCSQRCARSNPLGTFLILLSVAVLAFVAGEVYEAHQISRVDEEAVSAIPLPLPTPTPATLASGITL